MRRKVRRAARSVVAACDVQVAITDHTARAPAPTPRSDFLPHERRRPEVGCGRRLLRQSKRSNRTSSTTTMAINSPARPASAVTSAPNPPADAPLSDGCEELLEPDPGVPCELPPDDAGALPLNAPGLLEPSEPVAPSTGAWLVWVCGFGSEVEPLGPLPEMAPLPPPFDPPEPGPGGGGVDGGVPPFDPPPLPGPPGPPAPPPLPPEALELADPLDPEAALATDAPLTTTAVASALPVLPVLADDCAEPPLPPPLLPCPDATPDVESPVEPEAALALELLPVSVTSMARASPLLPDCDWDDEADPLFADPGATPVLVAAALPVLPDAACAEAEPIGAIDSNVACPELPDCEPEVAAGSLLSVTSVAYGVPVGDPPEPDCMLLASPLLVTAALPALPDFAEASALPMPPNAMAVASPELPDWADELCAGSFDPVPTDDDPEDPLLPDPFLSVAPPALPDWALASEEPVGARATAIAFPELPECADDGPG
jgi:hypothetical protein